MRITPALCALLTFVATVGCGGSSSLPSPECPTAGCSPAPTVSVAFDEPMPAIDEMDLLFVLDDTPAAAGIAAAVAAQMAKMAPVLSGLPDGQPPLHVAFIPGTIPSMGCPAPARRQQVCGLVPGAAFLTSGFCGIAPNFSGSLSDAFACLSDYGASDCGTFQPLGAARRALTDSGPDGLAAFVTPGAQLAILVVAGQDDASASNGTLVPVETYASQFSQLAPNAYYPVLLGPSSCPAGGSLTPVETPRLGQFASDTLGFMASVCDPSWEPAVTELATRSGVLYLPPCMTGIRDSDPNQPGTQASCVVQDEVVEANGQRSTSMLPACDGGSTNLPCWSVVSDQYSPGCWRPQVTRPADPVAICGPLATHTRFTCLSSGT